MKVIKALVWVSLLVGSTTLYAQNVGIGNTNPSYKVDVSGRIRIRGGTNENFSSGLWLTGSGADSTNNRMFIGMESDTAAGFYSQIFGSTGWFFVADALNARIGIRNRNPKYPLSFNNASGDKISLFTDALGRYYGLGVGSSTLQLLVPGTFASTVFGYGLSSSFNETMRIQGDGIVGIGESNPTTAGLVVNKLVGSTHAVFGSNTTGVAIESANPGIGFNSYYNGARKAIAAGYSGYIGVSPSVGGMSFLVSGQSLAKDATGTYNTAIDIKPDGKIGIGVTDPAYLLDLAGRMRIRGATGFTAGLWLNNEANNASPAFIGLRNNTEVGFYGTGTGWSLTMNTQTGAMAFGGVTGQPGQVLTSNGASGAPVWQTPPQVFGVNQPNAVFFTDNRVDLPGTVASFTLTRAARVKFNFGVSASTFNCFACGNKRVNFFLEQNVSGGTVQVSRSVFHIPENLDISFTATPVIIDLPPGSYSYKLSISGGGQGSAINASANTGSLIWEIFYQ